ncbi:MAG: hypothetical protein HY909_24025 [Deltaproteobacteria bacterium]|nr:hypothetical protein [Deltaproteobacteria bacterium]
MASREEAVLFWGYGSRSAATLNVEARDRATGAFSLLATTTESATPTTLWGADVYGWTTAATLAEVRFWEPGLAGWYARVRVVEDGYLGISFREDWPTAYSTATSLYEFIALGATTNGTEAVVRTADYTCASYGQSAPDVARCCVSGAWLTRVDASTGRCVGQTSQFYGAEPIPPGGSDPPEGDSIQEPSLVFVPSWETNDAWYQGRQRHRARLVMAFNNDHQDATQEHNQHFQGWATSENGMDWVVHNFVTDPLPTSYTGSISVRSYWGDTSLTTLGDGRVVLASQAKSGGTMDLADLIVVRVSTDGGDTFPRATLVNDGFGASTMTEVSDIPEVTSDPTDNSFWVAWVLVDRTGLPGMPHGRLFVRGGHLAPDASIVWDVSSEAPVPADITSFGPWGPRVRVYHDGAGAQRVAIAYARENSSSSCPSGTFNGGIRLVTGQRAGGSVAWTDEGDVTAATLPNCLGGFRVIARPGIALVPTGPGTFDYLVAVTMATPFPARLYTGVFRRPSTGGTWTQTLPASPPSPSAVSHEVYPQLAVVDGSNQVGLVRLRLPVSGPGTLVAEGLTSMTSGASWGGVQSLSTPDLPIETRADGRALQDYIAITSIPVVAQNPANMPSPTGLWHGMPGAFHAAWPQLHQRGVDLPPPTPAVARMQAASFGVSP